MREARLERRRAFLTRWFKPTAIAAILLYIAGFAYVVARSQI